MRNPFLALILLFWISTCNSIFAQDPVYTSVFQGNDVDTKASPWGNLLDLSESVPQRRIFVTENPLSTEKSDFSIVLWVQGSPRIRSEQSIVATMDKIDEKVTADWKIGVQANGAWFWEVPKQYEYHPTPERQSICDGRWHQLVVTYNSSKKDVRLYRDGRNVAIYHTPNLKKPSGKKLLIGGIPKGEIMQEGILEGKIGQVRIYNRTLDEKSISADFRKIMTDLGISAHSETPPSPAKNKLSVMEWNIWHGGRERGADIGVRRVSAMIREANPDIIILIETYGSGAKISDELNYYFYLRSSNLSIMSRYPIEETIDGGAPFSNGGAYIDLGNARRVLALAAWITYGGNYWLDLGTGKPMTAEAWEKQHLANSKMLAPSLKKLHLLLQRRPRRKLPSFSPETSMLEAPWIGSSQPSI